MDMMNVKLEGISRFRIKFLKIRVEEMEAECRVEFDKLVLRGEFTMSMLLSRTMGMFCIDFLVFW